MRAPVFPGFCYFALFGVLSVAGLTSCTPPASWNSTNGDRHPTDPGYTSFFDPYPETALGSSGIAVRFYSADSSFEGIAGYSFWMFGTASGCAADAGGLVMAADVDKVIGYSAAGFGIVFAVQAGGADFYALLIDIAGNWEIGKVVNRVYNAMGPGWRSSGGVLHCGYNQINRIGAAVTETANGVEIAVTLNGTVFASIQDTDSTVYSDGAFGFVVTTAPGEPSITNPVDVRFGPIVPADLGL
ncbi:MAG TPA: hypothetical protein VMW87_13180 [Spirochaetia bacterium]|nr:hypothetical protein [Spirochaetia bacterium]